MTISEFFGKFKNWSLWGNLVAMAVTVVLLVVGAKYGLDIYTHHGESIAIPKLLQKNVADAERIANHFHLKIEVADTGYVKRLPPGSVLEQSPMAGERVKSGHVIYITINATKSPTIKLPDIIDNSSLREAMAKLTAMGFKLAPPQFIAGEKDWVYGVLMDGKHVVYGDRIPVDAMLTIQAGNGMRDANESVNFIDPAYPFEDDFIETNEVDGFEEVTEPSGQHPESSEETTPQAGTEPKRHAEPAPPTAPKSASKSAGKPVAKHEPPQE